jgi:hypothetical protein
MISQAEKAVKEAEDKGLAANQALLERQEALNKLKEEAAQKKKKVKEERELRAVLLQHRPLPHVG